jgi:hypothetical protein
LRSESTCLQDVREFQDRIWETFLEVLDALVIHTRGTVVLGDLLECRPEIPFGENLIKKSKPFSSFHSLFQSRQHANGPGTRFDPSPSRKDLFGLLSLWH